MRDSVKSWGLLYFFLVLVLVFEQYYNLGTVRTYLNSSTAELDWNVQMIQWDTRFETCTYTTRDYTYAHMHMDRYTYMDRYTDTCARTCTCTRAQEREQEQEQDGTARARHGMGWDGM